MDLEITIPSARGRRPAAIEVSYLRDLDVTDVALLKAGYNLGSSPPAVQKIRTSHHELARLLASGVKPVEASAITGYSQSRISILSQDPAFKNLVSFYSEGQKEEFFNAQQRLRQLGLDATDELRERLAENPDQFTNEELRKLSETLFDRSGLGPKSTVEVQQGLDSSTLLQLKEAIKTREAVNVIEITDYQKLENSDGTGGGTEFREENQTLIGTAERVEISETIRKVAETTDES